MEMKRALVHTQGKIRELTGRIDKRDKLSLLWNNVLLNFAIVGSAVLSYLLYSYSSERDYSLSLIFLVLIWLQIAFLGYKYMKNLHLRISNILLFPLSPFKIYSVFSKMFVINKVNVIYLSSMIVLIVMLGNVTDGIVLFSYTFLVIVTLQIWLINGYLSLGPYLEAKKTYFVLIVFFVVSTFMHLLNITRNRLMFNYVPFSGWIGSTINAFRDREYGIVGIYCFAVLLLLTLGLWLGKSLVKARRKVRWDI